MSESEFLTQVLQLCRLQGWRVAHFRPGRTAKGWRTPCQADAKGWPDLVLVKGKRVLFVELKSDKGRLAPEQMLWQDALSRAGQAVLIWRPKMWKHIEDILTER